MRFLNSVSILTAALAATTSALSFGLSGLTPRQVREMSEAWTRIETWSELTARDHVNQEWGGFRLVDCSLAGIYMPKTGGPDLTYPTSIMQLSRVVLGLGTHNYTCAQSTEGTPYPTPIFYGAVASLYDASCLVKYSPLLHSLPNVLIQVPYDLLVSGAGMIQKPWIHEKLFVGHHYFPNSTTPTFDFSTTSSGDGKIFFGKVEERVPAPENASKGRVDKTEQMANGAVNWLRLSPKEGTIGYMAGYSVLTAGYRVLMAGGKPPQNYSAYPHRAKFEVPYVTEYW